MNCTILNTQFVLINFLVKCQENKMQCITQTYKPMVLNNGELQKQWLGIESPIIAVEFRKYVDY